MKATGIVRPVDELGRIVLPKELRRTMNISDNDPLEIFVDDDAIVLRKYQPGCMNCKRMADLTTMGGITLCRDCIEKFSEAVQS